MKYYDICLKIFDTHITKFINFIEDIKFIGLTILTSKHVNIVSPINFISCIKFKTLAM